MEKPPKFIWIAGVRFCRDEKTGYYRNGTIHKLAHRFAYETFIGPIPDGFHVHHKDHDRGNNDPSNLEALHPSDHQSMHGWINGQMPDRVKRAIQNMIDKAVPAAKDWHRSPEGREWHRQHAYNSIALPQIKWFECEECGNPYEADYQGRNRFCSNVCKSRARRKSGADNVVRKCTYCEGDFTCNKYAKTHLCSQACANRLRDSVGTMRARTSGLRTGDGCG